MSLFSFVLNGLVYNINSNQFDLFQAMLLQKWRQIKLSMKSLKSGMNLEPHEVLLLLIHPLEQSYNFIWFI